MASFADIKIRFGADLKQFSSQMQNANRTLQQTGRQMQKIGTGLTLGVTAPLLALGAAAVKNFDEQAKAVAQVEQGLISTGNAVGFTTEQLKKQASELQNSTIFGDEKILKDATAQLLTFTNIVGEQFSRTQSAALDLATRLDGDLKSASIQLGKALNDPIANLSALSRSGIQFSEDQKILIKALVETGQIAKAQTLILDELERQYGGSAAAAAKAGLGPFTQFKNILGDITEDFGEIILEGLKPFVENLKAIALRFKDLSPETKKFIAILAGIAAAAGPLLALAGTILPAIGTGLALLTGPIGLVIAGVTAIGVAIYKNWEPIKATLVEIANYFIDLYNESEVFRIGVEAIRTSFQNLYEIGAFVFGAIGTIFKTMLEQMKDGFRPFGELIRAVLTGDLKRIPVIIAAGFKTGLGNAKNLISDLGKDFENLKGTIETNITEGVDRALSGKKYELLSANVDTQGLEDKVAEAVQKGLERGAAGGPFTPQTKKLEIDSPGIASVGSFDLSTSLADTFQAEPLDDKLLGFTDRMNQFKEESAQILEDTAVNFAAGFGEIIGGIIAGTAGLDDVAALLLNTLGDLAQRIGKAVIKIGVTMQALELAIKNPLGAILAGGALVAFGALMKSFARSFAGNFSTGGIVGGGSYSGDKLLAGVNSGELILNIAQQKNLAAALSARTPIILQPSIVMDPRGFKVILNKAENLNARTT